MQQYSTYAFAAALACGALSVLHGVVWQATRQRGASHFSLAFAALSLFYGLNPYLALPDPYPSPEGSVFVGTALALITFGMVDYAGFRGRLAAALRGSAVVVAIVALLISITHAVPAPVAAVLFALELGAHAVMAFLAMRREPGRGHGILCVSQAGFPILIMSAALGWVDGGGMRYLAAMPIVLTGMTVLTSGLLRAQRLAREELQGRERAEAALREFNEKLEQRVAMRTEELRGMVSALESFNRSISHDLRGPLGGIAGVSRLATDALDAGDVAAARRLLPAITRQAETSAELVASLLALARVNEVHLEPRPVDLNQVVHDTLAQLRLHDPGLATLPVQVGPLPTVDADPCLVRQVYVNLIGNAVKFSRQSAEPLVELGAYDEGGEQVMFVRDNGVGFESERADHLFEPFQQLHAGRFPGHGVGLSIVKRIVERHGGRVWACSTPEQGATFYFSLAHPAA